MKKYEILLLVIFLISFSQSQEYSPDSNTVALWHFNEMTLNPIVDASGFNNQGIAYGTTIVDGKYNNCRLLNGINDYIEIPDSPSLDFSVAKEFIVEAWININSIPSQYGHIVDKWGTGNDEDDEWTLQFENTGKICFAINSATYYASPDIVLYSKETMPLNEWIHVAGVWNGKTGFAALYINGKPDTITNSAITSIAETNQPVWVGWDGMPSNHFHGNIDEIRISNKTRTPNDFNLKHYVLIDIKPGSFPNSINCQNQNGVIPVAILSTPEFDARTVDHTTVRFGPSGAKETHCVGGNGGKGQRIGSGNECPLKRHEEDVDGDGDIDLIFHFKHSETGLACSDTIGTLTGKTFSDKNISGSDIIRPVRSENYFNPQITEDAIPLNYILSENFPNPFNPTTVIKYGLSEDANVTLSVFNTLGQEVALLASGFQKAGYHEVTFDGSGLTSGVYFYRLQVCTSTGSVFVETKKLLLMK
ncbi:MAG: T9SS type A sorting domain-containing protein [Ignavibacteriales bacterium]|nr:T9SS type A sorting domain-containing protein [Ignavibacteriales bacterium]